MTVRERVDHGAAGPVIGSLAFAVSIVACGLTAAAWVRLVLPLFGGTPLG